MREAEFMGIPVSELMKLREKYVKNELRIKPLLRYEVSLFGEKEPDVFTADGFGTVGAHTQFFRTGNVIRAYAKDDVRKIIITPVDNDN